MSSRSYQRWPMNRPSAYTARPSVPGWWANAGVSSRRFGNVIGSRPPGSASPVSTSTSASPISWPGNHSCRTAGTSSSHGIVTGEPVLSTTTVFGLAATTAATRSSWSPGSASDVRSSPSVSQSSSVPTMTIATSAPSATAAARAMASSAGTGAGTDDETPHELVAGRPGSRPSARSGGPPPARPCRGPPGCPCRRRRRRAATRSARRRSRRRARRVTGPTARTPSSHVPRHVGHERAGDRGRRTPCVDAPAAGGLSQNHASRLAAISAVAAGRRR